MAAILAARHELGVGPHRLAPVVGSPRSTISDVLRRHGLSRLRDRDRPSGVPIRYVRERPGELLHIDVKKLGRIPDGGGHRFRGRGKATPRARRGYDYVHGAIDDMSRVAYVDVFSDERGPTCAQFLRDAAAWFARQGVRIERVMTDNARNYVDSRDFQAALSDIEARHKRTRPRRPQTNGKSERFNRTLLDEWAYVRPYETNTERLMALPVFVDHYNNHRPHTALKGSRRWRPLSTTCPGITPDRPVGPTATPGRTMTTRSRSSRSAGRANRGSPAVAGRGCHETGPQHPRPLKRLDGEGCPLALVDGCRRHCFVPHEGQQVRVDHIGV